MCVHYACRALDIRQVQMHRAPAADWGYALQNEPRCRHVAVGSTLDAPRGDLLAIFAHQALDGEGCLVACAARLARRVAGCTLAEASVLYWACIYRRSISHDRTQLWASDACPSAMQP